MMTPEEQAKAANHYQWRARWRCDMEEQFCTEEHIFTLETVNLSEAAKIIEKQIGWNTLIELEWVDV